MLFEPLSIVKPAFYFSSAPVAPDGLGAVNTMYGHAQDAAQWAGSAVLAFMGCLALAALAAFVIQNHL